MTESNLQELFIKLTDVRHYNKWLDTKVPVFGMKTPRQMLSDNRGAEVEKVLNKLLRGGFMDNKKSDEILESKNEEQRQKEGD